MILGQGEADAGPEGEGGRRGYLLKRQRGRDGGGEQAVINYVEVCD